MFSFIAVESKNRINSDMSSTILSEHFPNILQKCLRRFYQLFLQISLGDFNKFSYVYLQVGPPYWSIFFFQNFFQNFFLKFLQQRQVKFQRDHRGIKKKTVRFLKTFQKKFLKTPWNIQLWRTHKFLEEVLQYFVKMISEKYLKNTRAIIPVGIALEFPVETHQKTLIEFLEKRNFLENICIKHDLYCWGMS